MTNCAFDWFCNILNFITLTTAEDLNKSGNFENTHYLPCRGLLAMYRKTKIDDNYVTLLNHKVLCHVMSQISLGVKFRRFTQQNSVYISRLPHLIITTVTVLCKVKGKVLPITGH